MQLVSQILGWLLTAIGSFFVFGAFFIKEQGGRPLWMYAVVIVTAGALPLCSGIALLMRRYRGLKTAMGLVFGCSFSIFVSCWLTHVFLPDAAETELEMIAGSGLIAAAISTIVWITAFLCWRDVKRGIRRR